MLLKDELMTILEEKAQAMDFGDLPGIWIGNVNITAREHQVGMMLAFGYTDSIIAEHLNLSVKNVQTNTYWLRKKLQVTSNEAAAKIVEAHSSLGKVWTR